jgi:hypothetical protein
MRYAIWLRQYRRTSTRLADGSLLWAASATERPWKPLPDRYDAGEANAECERLQRALCPTDGVFFVRSDDEAGGTTW